MVLEGVLPKAKVDLLVETILQFEQDYQRDKVPPKSHMFFTSTTWDFFRIDNLPHLAACFRDYVTNPKIVGLAEDAVGGSVRLEQSDAHIRRRDLSQPNPVTMDGIAGSTLLSVIVVRDCSTARS